MKFELLYEPAECANQTGVSRLLAEFLNHALLRKPDVNYRPDEKIVIVHLNRLIWQEKESRWFRTRVGDEKRAVKCTLTIRDVESCEIRDEHPGVQETKVSLALQHGEIYIGASCEHGNGYLISIKAKRINITFEDR